ncbi:MAG: sigma-70 family RNA polymerase sigma factor [Verrucomicrobiota bacterium]|nr:sigma-70 family RNA polymerase sigma factor [Verrucomicrobiota bacterium]
MDGTNSSGPVSDPTEPMIDSELVRAFQKEAREEAFDELVRRYQSLVINMAYQMLQNHDEAVEAAQDVFVKVYHALPQFEERSSFKTWLYTITRRVVLNRIRHLASRKASAHVSLQHEDYGEALAARPELTSTVQPDHELMSAERFGQLTGAIGKLDPDHREILILREIQELSYDEIAVITGLNVGTVKSRISRAREELKTILKRLGIGAKYE